MPCVLRWSSQTWDGSSTQLSHPSVGRQSWMRRYVDEVRALIIVPHRTRIQVLDATLKEITAALLESDVNVKLVASLRQKVKAKIKAALDGSDKSKDLNRKHLMQKVTSPARSSVTDAYCVATRPSLTNLST